PLLVDCDTGIDDAIALTYLAAHPDAESAGVVSTGGNVDVAAVHRNNLALAELLGLAAPIARGADRPLVQEPMYADDTHGPGARRLPAGARRRHTGLAGAAGRRGARRRLAALRRDGGLRRDAGGGWRARVHGPPGAGHAVTGGFAGARPLAVDVELAGTRTRGQTVGDELGRWGREPNVDLLTAVRPEDVIEHLLSVLERGLSR